MAPSAAGALPGAERMIGKPSHLSSATVCDEETMMERFARRDVLSGSVAIAASGAFASVTSAAPPPSPVTPELIAAAKKEGRVVYYTSIDLPVAERIAKAF